VDSPAAAIIVMGVAGCGKTTVGTLLARRLGVPYLEADGFHPPANVAKMRAGSPLTDDDRQPWLAAIARQVTASAGPKPVVSCSALKRRYRDQLRQADPRAWFLHLAISEAAASQRVAARPGHFMPQSLVPSQLADLEPLQAEAGLTVDATQPPEDIVSAAVRELTAQGLLTAPEQPRPAAPGHRTMMTLRDSVDPIREQE
jgi:gluconokinase